MSSSTTKTLALTATTALTAGLIVASPAAHANDMTATQIGFTSSAVIAYTNGKTANANLTRLDRTGDGDLNNFAYCIEPGVDTPKEYKNGSTPFKGVSVDWSKYNEPGKIRWTLTHGAKAVSVKDINARSGADTDGVPRAKQHSAAISATQSAIWGWAFGWRVSPTFTFDRRTTAEAAAVNKYFHQTYNYLMSNAENVPKGDHEWVLWTESGAKNVQDLIQVPTPKTTPQPKPKPEPKPEPKPKPSNDGSRGTPDGSHTIVIDGKRIHKVWVKGQELTGKTKIEFLKKLKEQGLNSSNKAEFMAKLTKIGVKIEWQAVAKPDKKKPSPQPEKPKPGADVIKVDGKIISGVWVNGRKLSAAEAQQMLKMLQEKGVDFSGDASAILKQLQKAGVKIDWSAGGSGTGGNFEGEFPDEENVGGVGGGGHAGGGFFSRLLGGGSLFGGLSGMFKKFTGMCGGLFGSWL